MARFSKSRLRGLLVLGVLAGLCLLAVSNSFAQGPEPPFGPDGAPTLPPDDAGVTPPGDPLLLQQTPEISPTVEITTTDPLSPTLPLTATEIVAPTVFATSTVDASPTVTASPTATVTPTATATPSPILPTGDDVVSFSQLGYSEDVLFGSFDSTALTFALPADWELTADPEVALSVVTFVAGAQGAVPAAENLGCSLEVSLNQVQVGTTVLDHVGERVLIHPIPDTALTAAGDGRHELYISFNGAPGCQTTSVTVQADSGLVLPHRATTPPADLRFLPRPIYQGSFLPDTATIVVPDEPTAGELQAALNVAAGFGRMTDGKLALELVPASRLTDELIERDHLIFVGNFAAFGDWLPEVALPLPAGGTGGDAPAAAAEDGIVQIAISPWNPAKVVLVVGGETEPAIVKAGQALSSGVIGVGAEPDVAIIAEVQTDQVVPSVPVDRSLADLGYDATTMRRIGATSTEYRFYVPPGQLAGTDSYFDLVFSHSAIVSFERSRVDVTLNDVPIGSARFREQPGQRGNVRLVIPRSALRSGNNRLVVSVNLLPPFDQTADRADLWLIIWPESLLHLQLSPTQLRVPPGFDLSAYPDLLVLTPTLNNVAFVLPRDGASAWTAAAQIASNLGDTSDGSVADLAVAYADAIPENLRRERDLVIVGRPTALPVIAELGEALPAPFPAESNVAIERRAPVVVRVPSDTSIGYLQLLTAPWQHNRAVLAVLGSTDESLRWAARALTAPELRQQLSGNLALVSGEHITSNDTRVAPVEPGTAAQEPGAIPGFGATAVDPGRPRWILPLLGVSLLGMLIITSVVVISSLRRRPTS